MWRLKEDVTFFYAKNFYLFLCGCLFSISTHITAQNTLQNGLVAYYPFNGNTLDASGNGNQAFNNRDTLTAAADGSSNGAYLFDGINDYMTIPQSSALTFTDRLSLFALVRVDGFYQGLCYNNIIIDHGIDHTSSLYSLRFTQDGVSNGNCYVNDTISQTFTGGFGLDGPTHAQNAQPPFVQSGHWYCLALTVDSAVGRLYVNGVPSFTFPRYSGNISGAIHDIFLGRKNSIPYPYWFNGVMDEVRIYNRALTAAEVGMLCEMGSTSIPESVGATNKPEDLLEVFPNPATTSITIAGALSGSSYCILNVGGQVLQTGLLTKDSKIRTENLASGLYLLRLTDGSHVRHTRFVKD